MQQGMYVTQKKKKNGKIPVKLPPQFTILKIKTSRTVTKSV